jgi:hypothetical protein
VIRLHVDRTRRKHGDTAGEDVSVTEDVFNPRLAHHGSPGIISNWRGLAADHHHAAARAEGLEHRRRRFLAARCFKHHFDSPSLGFLADPLGEIFLGHVDGRDRPEARSDFELGIVEVADKDSRAARRQGG